MPIERLRGQLIELNAEIAGFCGCDPVELSFQSGETGEDNLFLYGIVGGKDVGKTSLINRLAGSRISVDTDILDEGTRVATAYCHEDDASALHKRLGADADGRVEIQPHRREELKNVVLIDFPDYDSRFIKHRDDVELLSKYLQGIVWVISPRKYGDHEFLQQLESVAQSHEFYYIVLNKVDQIADQSGLDEIREEVLGYLQKECVKRNVSSPQAERFFMISALDTKKFQFQRLYERLVRMHSPEEILRAKSKNIKTEFEKNLSRIREYYRLPMQIESVNQALDTVQEQVSAAFDDNYFETVRERMQMLVVLQQRVASRLMMKRIEKTPLLWLLFYPFMGLISGLGSWFMQSKSLGGEWDSPKDLLRYQGKTASLHIQDMLNLLERTYPEIMQWADLQVVKPAQLYDRFESWIREYEDDLTQHLSQTIRAPGVLKRILLYFPLIWFPFIQPIGFEVMHSEENLFSLTRIWDLLGVMLGIVSAGSLLVSLVFLVIFYSAWLFLMYAGCVRLTKEAGDEEIHSLWYDKLLRFIIHDLSSPFIQVRNIFEGKVQDLERIESILVCELQKFEVSK